MIFFSRHKIHSLSSLLQVYPRLVGLWKCEFYLWYFYNPLSCNFQIVERTCGVMPPWPDLYQIRTSRNRSSLWQNFSRCSRWRREGGNVKESWRPHCSGCAFLAHACSFDATYDGAQDTLLPIRNSWQGDSRIFVHDLKLSLGLFETTKSP